MLRVLNQLNKINSEKSSPSYFKGKNAESYLMFAERRDF